MTDLEAFESFAAAVCDDAPVGVGIARPAGPHGEMEAAP